MILNTPFGIYRLKKEDIKINENSKYFHYTPALDQ